MNEMILAIDQGTTSSRAVLFDRKGTLIAKEQQTFVTHFPQDGWVEHNPQDIWQSVLSCCQTVIANSQMSVSAIKAIGISNQRETTLLWDRVSGEAIYPAIVWQDRRTAEVCDALRSKLGLLKTIRHKTGLLLDPYFSATKIAWILDHVDRARDRALAGELAFGTVDSYLLWRFTNGQSHYTDASNAARTSLFNIHTQVWDDELLALFDIPKSLLPEVLDNAAAFGETDARLFGRPIAITGMAGDQQAASIGQACFSPGMLKSTYGTGCFMMLNTGNKVIESNNQLLSTVAYRLNNRVSYALEGSIFVAGAAVQWLRDQLQLIAKSSDTETIAASIADTGGVYLVPAFTGLGAPYWDPHARGALFGLTRDTSQAHIVRATLEAVCYQTKDLLDAVLADYAGQMTALRVDGGMAENNWFLQFLADITNIKVQRPGCIETSVLGAAYLAGLGAGLYQSLDEIAELWQIQQQFESNMSMPQRDNLHQGWRRAVKATMLCSSDHPSKMVR